MSVLTPAQRILAAEMSEADLLANLDDACEKLDLRLFHVRDARRQKLKDMPDALIVGDGRLWLFELKKQSGRPTPGQRQILEYLGECGTYRAGLWRPSDWLSGRIDSELRGEK